MMKARDHEREIKRILVEHAAERRRLKEQITILEQSNAALRERTQRAEQRIIEVDEGWLDFVIAERTMGRRY